MKNPLPKTSYDQFMFMVNMKFASKGMPPIDFVEEPISFEKFREIVDHLAAVAVHEIALSYRRGLYEAENRRPVLNGGALIVGFLLGGGVVFWIMT